MVLIVVRSHGLAVRASCSVTAGFHSSSLVCAVAPPFSATPLLVLPMPRTCVRNRHSAKLASWGVQGVAREPSEPSCRSVMLSAVSGPLARQVKDAMLRVGVEVVGNVDDFDDDPRAAELSVAQLALVKARQVHRATGLPVIAERSGWSVEASVGGGGGRGRTSAYAFNDITDQVTVSVKPSVSSRHKRCPSSNSVCAGGNV